jgi:hypothetical protein
MSNSLVYRAGRDAMIHALPLTRPRCTKCMRCNYSIAENVIVGTSFAGAFAGLGLSSLYLLRDVDSFLQTSAGQQQSGAQGQEDDDSFVFAVSTVISLIPYLNWLVRLCTSLKMGSVQKSQGSEDLPNPWGHVLRFAHFGA